METPRTLEDWNLLPWLLTQKQVLRLTGLSQRALYRAEAEGALRRHRPGKAGRYFRVEIETFVGIGRKM